ncbi:MAG: low specificity L-threonine aldolase [Acidimicrobiales bacterium]|nr:low specificity L-threonine aldolase [Acidimicrobiales bacterium]
MNDPADAGHRIELRSDNAAGAAPELLAAVAGANTGSALAYGGDEWTRRLEARASEVFERPGVRVFPVVSGTAANALSLSALCPPWGAVLCHESAHILRSECGASSMLGGGLQLRGLPGPDTKLTVDAVHAAFASTNWGDNHHAQPSVLSLTSPTDLGAIYQVDEVAELAAAARERGLRVHLDGARLANALVALGCSAAELTWRAGVDVVSLGALKNGGLSCDAIVCFDDAAAAELHYRTKRSGHVASKMRFQSAQLDAYLADGLWLRLAASANATMARLTAGLDRLGVELVVRPAVNMVFARLDGPTADALAAAGVDFYRMGPDTVRFVTSWQTTPEDIDAVLAVLERHRA